MELAVADIEYCTSSKLDVFTQMHLARKLGNALSVLEAMTAAQNVSKDKTLLTVMMLGNVSDADSEYIVKKCLSVVTRKQDDKLVKIQTPDGHLLFDDITLAAMLELTVNVIEENLGDFFRTALTDLRAVQVRETP